MGYKTFFDDKSKKHDKLAYAYKFSEFCKITDDSNLSYSQRFFKQKIKKPKSIISYKLGHLQMPTINLTVQCLTGRKSSINTLHFPTYQKKS